ncbi:hypothetical protein [Thermovibrio sp.]
MVQLLLILNLLGLFVIFLFALTLYFTLRELRYRLDEVEKELLKEKSLTSEIGNKVERLENNYSFIYRELKRISEGLGVRRV